MNSVLVAAIAALEIAAPGTSLGDASVAKQDMVQAEIDSILMHNADARQIADGIVEFDGGAVRLVYASNAREATEMQEVVDDHDSGMRGVNYLHGCPYGRFAKWVCFYENWYFNEKDNRGRMLQFRDKGHQRLTDYGFGNMTSSMVNTSSSKITVYSSEIRRGMLFEMYHGTRGDLGRHNDRAKSFNR